MCEIHDVPKINIIQNSYLGREKILLYFNRSELDNFFLIET